jgi:hypothetical protein
MARGRFVSKEVCIDKKVNDLKDPWAMLGFTWLITHADVDGRTYGDPELVKSLIFPRQREITDEDVERFIRQWQDAGMIEWYEVEEEKFIQFLNFEKHQVGIRRDKEPVSSIPANPLSIREERRVAENVRNDGGKVAENVQNDGVKSPPEVKEKLREIKVEQEVEVVVPVAGAPGDDGDLLAVFETVSGMTAPRGLPKVMARWEEAISELVGLGVTEQVLRQAVEEMTEKKFKILGPWSMRRPCEVILGQKKREQVPKGRKLDSEGQFAAFVNR